ncbi:MAG: amidohydrolase, partial [Planctomycetota bacterium]
MNLSNCSENKKIIMKRFSRLLLLLFLPFSVFADSDLSTKIKQDYDYLQSLYYHLHKNPELSFHEVKTAKRISKELRKAGFDVTENVGGHGLVGVLKNGPGPTLMLRTDLDALPVEEKTGLEYASKTTVVDDLGNKVHAMHACGHDIHMTVFAGTARRLADLRDKWSGTLVMIGEPAEERGAGARALLNDGLYTRFPRPDYAMGLHANAGLAAGQIGYVEGYALANVDMVDISVFGIGGHG